MSEPTTSDDGRPSGSAWIARFAESVGLDAPDPARVETLLDLAGVAAHASERTAAPIACYLVGLAGLEPERALDLARDVAAEG